MRYPLLAVYAAVPLAVFAADNGDLLGPGQLLPYYLGALLPALAITAAVARGRGAAAADRLSACLAVAIFITFDYRDLRQVLGPLTSDTKLSMVFLWAVLLGGAMLLTARIARRVPRLPLLMLAVGVVMLAPPVARMVGHPRTATAKAGSTGRGLAGLRLTQRPAPNVYLYLLDAYGRADRLQQQFAFDNSRVIADLRRHGFVVPPGSRASYPITQKSVPSILDMGYLGTRPGSASAQSVPVMAGRNRVVGTFRRLGYDFALAPSEFIGWNCRGLEDRCVRPVATYQGRIGVSDTTWAVLERTPAADLLQAIRPSQVSNMAANRQFPWLVSRTVTRWHRGRDRPMFVFTHSLLSHWPYPYQGSGCELQAGEPSGASDYIGAIRCVNARVLRTVRFLEHADPTAVIVFASDHGSDVGVHLSQALPPGSVTANRRYSNFVALKLPRPCRDDVPRDLAAVNIFRVVMNCVTTSRLPLLRYRQMPS